MSQRKISPKRFLYVPLHGWRVDSADATIHISVQAVNDPPTAYNQSVSVQLNGSVNIQLSASDPESDPITFSIISNPSKGTISNFSSPEV